MSRIETILQQATIGQLKSVPAVIVDPETTLSEVCRILDEGNRSAVLICDDHRLTGIFTQRDVLYRTSQQDLHPALPISEVMTADPDTLGPGQPLGEAIELMIGKGYRQVPLVDENRHPVGLLTSHDILSFVAGHYPESVLNLPPQLDQVLRRPEGA